MIRSLWKNILLICSLAFLADPSFGSELVLNEECLSPNADWQFWCTEKVNRHGFLSDTQMTWDIEKKRRLETLENYISNNQEGYEAFALGAIGKGQVPSIMMTVFPELFPELWGGYQFEKMGFLPHPTNKDSKFPSSIGHQQYPLLDEKGAEITEAGQTVQLNYASFNCQYCHGGGVIDESGKYTFLPGAPSPRAINLLNAIARTSLHENFTADQFVKALKDKDLSDWLYADQEEVEKDRAQFIKNAAKIVKMIKERSTLFVQGAQIFYDYVFNEDVRATLKGHKVPPVWNPKTGYTTEEIPGYLDALAPNIVVIASLVKKLSSMPPNPVVDQELTTYYPSLKASIEKMKVKFPGDFYINGPQAIHELLLELVPDGPANVDLQSLWTQNTRGGKSHWDGSIGVSPFHRHAAAAKAEQNNPVDLDQVAEMTEFVKDFPSPPYPFPVDLNMARKGYKHFKKYCIECHNGVVRSYDVGTDNQRLDYLKTSVVAEQFVNLAAGTPLFASDSACSSGILKRDEYCKKPDGSEFIGFELILDSSFYIADRMDGLWARAPYLHNGSVPTMRHLLLPELRDKEAKVFCRGQLTYDQKNMGYHWQPSADGKCPRQAKPYDTEALGSLNKGHD
ncbi:MAG: hypothetical protein AAF203_06710, partial [Pseudomonadota bacterium]